jgi:peroxiredoxin
MSYFYEMSLEKDPAGVVLGPEPPDGLKTWRALKMNSRRYFGDRVPVVRCWHHFAHPENPAYDNGLPIMLNLTLSGQVFRSTPAYEYEPQFVLSALATMERDLKLGPRHFLTIWTPVRAARYFSSVSPVTPEVSLRLHAVADHLTAASKSGPLLAEGSALTLIGTLYRTASFTEQAVVSLDRAIHAPGDHRQAATLLAEIYHDSGKDDRAIRFLEDLLSREPNEVQYMELLARAYRDDEQGAKADAWQGKIDHWLVGQPAPDFELTDTRGKRIRLSDKRGKVILLFFWNYGDQSSGSEAAWVEEWYNKYRAKDLVVYSLNEEPQHADVKGLARLTFTYPLLLDAALVFRQYGVLHVPTTYLIDSSGRVALRRVGFDADSYGALQKAIEKLLLTQSTFLPPGFVPHGLAGPPALSYSR